jgi:hypothetical protein
MKKSLEFPVILHAVRRRLAEHPAVKGPIARGRETRFLESLL